MDKCGSNCTAEAPMLDTADGREHDDCPDVTLATKDRVSTFTPEQIAEIRDLADHAAERILQEFGAWLYRNRGFRLDQTAKLTDDFLAEKRGWYA